jgi:hypothetical protein
VKHVATFTEFKHNFLISLPFTIARGMSQFFTANTTVLKRNKKSNVQATAYLIFFYPRSFQFKNGEITYELTQSYKKFQTSVTWIM